MSGTSAASGPGSPSGSYTLIHRRIPRRNGTEAAAMQPVVTVGLDGSTESLAAARWAADEADKRRLTLRLPHAWPLLLPERAHATSGVDQDRRLPVVGRRARRHSGTPPLEPVAHAAIHHGRCPVAVFPHD